MCGILLLHGEDARRRLAARLPFLRHRGSDGAEFWTEGTTALGFNRLAINDKGPAGRQPYEHGQLVGAINGEIYNHRELVARHGLAVEGACDTRVVLPLFERLGARIIDELDGFYSGVIVDRQVGAFVCLRDHMGKKPLFVGSSRGALFITSELKALDALDWFELLPRGASRVDPTNRRIELLREHEPRTRRGDLRQLVGAAVTKRLPPADEPLGVFLSGGLDSSIVAALAVRSRSDVIYYTLGDADSPDRGFASAVAESLGLADLRVVPLPEREQLPGLIERVVYSSESYNPSIISNGLSTFLLAEAAHRDGLKVVLTGEGADELFCGYHRMREDQPWKTTRTRLIDDMQFTELRRLDSCSMAHAVEARCPFLDRAVRAHSDTLGYQDHFRLEAAGLQNKVSLRRAFTGLLPTAVIDRHKTSFDVGSGMRGLVVAHLCRNGRSEREELRDIWRRLFPFDASADHFHAYPVFDEAIDRRGAVHR